MKRALQMPTAYYDQGILFLLSKVFTKVNLQCDDRKVLSQNFRAAVCQP